MGYLTTTGTLLWATLFGLSLLKSTLADDCAVSLWPTIEPPHLVVKYKGPASAICTTNQSVDNMNWEANDGVKTKIDEQSTVWSVSSILWSLGNGVQCYTNTDDLQCLQHLPITIYKIPDSVILSCNESGPLKENREYTLRCEVKSVAPVENLQIIWYRGDTVMATSTNQSLFSTVAVVVGPDDKSQDVTASWTITASRKHPNATYSCAARLNLNATVESSCNNKTCTYTTEAINDTKSNDTQLEVWYGPDIVSDIGNVSLAVGDTLELSCQADANPSATYTWTHNNVTLRNENSSTLHIESVSVDHAGQYVCKVSNTVDSAQATMTVEVYRNHMVWIAVLLAIVVVAIIVIVLVAYQAHHMKNKTGQYKFTNLVKFRSGSQNGQVAVANGHGA